MTWPEVRFDGWDDFARYISGPVTGRGSYIFRGQARAEWPLIPSLLRLVETDDPVRAKRVLAVERRALVQFQSSAHLHVRQTVIPLSDDDYLGWWALMQHYGAPTRLLDWTRSPFVAAYFAVEQEWKQEGAVWFYHGDSVDRKMQERFSDYMRPPTLQQVSRFMDPDAPKELYQLSKSRATDRMIAQQGTYTVSTQVLTDHTSVVDEVLSEVSGVLPPGKRVFGKVVIPAQSKRDFLRYLQGMNITANALFPGADGLGRSIAELIRTQ